MNYITLTNNGYRELTYNLLKSMENLGIEKQLKIYCVDEECYNFFKELYPENTIINMNITDTRLYNWIPYRASQHPDVEGKKLWSTITFQKIIVMIKELEENDHFLFVDGDVVFLKDPQEDINKYIDDETDLIIQNDECDDNDDTKWCTGFFWMNSTPKNIAILKSANPNNFRNDQIFIRSNRNNLKFKVLKLYDYPNGKYFRTKNPIEPFIIHFNHDVEHKKIVRMKKFCKWFL